MGARRLLLVALASAVLLGTVRADEESARYARREAQTPALAEFRGGCPAGPEMLLLLPVVLVLLPFYLVYKGGEALYELVVPPAPPVPKSKAPPSCG